MLGFLVLAGAFGTAWADDLAGLYTEALAYDSQFRAARAQYVEVEERVPQSEAALRPSVALSANTVWNRISTNSVIIPQQSYNSNGYTVTLTQALLRFQSTAAVDQARASLDQAKAQLDLARQDLLIRTAQAYFDVLLARDTLNSVMAQRTANKQLLDQASRSFQIGTTAITDVRDAKAKYDIVTAQEIAARNDVASKTQTLRVIIGREPGELARLRSDVALTPPEPDNMEEWVAAAEVGNAAVIGAQAGLNVAKLEAKKARAMHAPTLDLVATDGFSRSGTTTTIGTDIRSSTIGLQLALPIYSGGATFAHEREVAAMLEKSDADLDTARRTGALAARQAYLGVSSGLAQVRALEQAVDSARTAVDANRRGKAVGVRMNVDILNALQQLATTERDLAKARYDTLLSLLRLKGAAGSLSDKDISRVNKLLSN